MAELSRDHYYLLGLPMAYSIFSMREALKRLGTSRGVNPFVWEEKDKTGIVHPGLAAKFLYGRRPNFVNDLLEYCWLVYSKSLQASGSQLIGRTDALWVPQQLEKANIDLQAHQTLWDPHTKGNIQVMDKWSPTVNDCWVLGGVHRLAEFELLSPMALQNLWDFKNMFHIVTAREVLGLLHFGYELERKNIIQARLVCRNAAAASQATLEDYDAYMKTLQAQGRESIRALVDPAIQKLQNDIRGFDKSRLKHVTPPK